MYCFNGKYYLPQPPRAWSRVQNSCSFESETLNPNTIVRLPYTNKEVPVSSLATELAMLNKGNVLQYKKNSSNLTKNQRYSQIAKGQWTNRHKTWATQSANGYTNPNNQQLARVGGVNVTLNGVVTDSSVTCPSNINNNTQVVIQDFGTLICGSKENVCTGEIVMPVKTDNCHLTADSDVPGPIETLCWNDGITTWYPRQRYIMTNSTDKWPVNAHLVSAVKPAPPLLSISSSFNIANLSWTTNDSGLPVTSYNVFKNNVFIGNTKNTSYSDVFDNTNGIINSYYVKSLSGNISSDASNIVVTNTYAYTTNGSVTNYNPLTSSTTPTGFTYILFNNVSSSYYFNVTAGNIQNLYYMIVGTGGQGQSGFSAGYYSQGGIGAGAGGCYNSVITNFPKNNYSIIIPNINLISDTIFKNATNLWTFNITASSGQFLTRGDVSITMNSVYSILSPSSSVSGEFGVGGHAYGVNSPAVITNGSDGGDVFKGTNGSVGNYIKFLGDGLQSNVLFGGGGGGGGAGNNGGTNHAGYNGGGGGGGGGTGSTSGGTGVNGSSGLVNANGGNGGAGFNTIQGYGGGGGGGGAGPFSGFTVRGIGGSGGHAMLLLYF